MKSTTHAFILLFICCITPPKSIEGFTGAYTAMTVNHGVKRSFVKTMMVDTKMEGISERNAKLLAQAERLRAEGLSSV